MKNIAKYNEALINLLHAAAYVDTDLVSTEEYVHSGILFVDDKGPVEQVDKTTGELAVKAFGYNWDIWNKSFHKSWDKVAKAPLDQLVWEQIIHYFSTYGMEAMGLKASPYIPVEDILPEELRPEVARFTVIKIVSEKDALDLADNYLKTILKPNARNVEYIKTFMEMTLLDIDDFKSFEVKCLYCDINGFIPSDPQDLLRYLVYTAINGTLIIKNKETINAIKYTLQSKKDVADKVHRILAKADLVELSKIFLRNKNLFLAFKVDKRNATIINKIRRLAVNNHQPLSEVTVANVMNLLGQKREADVLSVLKRTSNRNLIKLINYANTEGDDHIYNIRNGKVYINNKPANKENLTWLSAAADYQLKANLADKLAGKKFYIPAGVDYKAPISEKQMLGVIPYGTTISADLDADAICASIAWENYKGTRTDIDLHIQSLTRMFGWNSGYRSSGSDILYSGDMTDATDGATESYRFSASDEIFLATVNLFSGENDVPFKFFLNEADDFRTEDEGLIDISKALVTPIKLAFNGTRSMSLGYMVGTTFTFYGGNLGMGIVPKRELYNNALTAITNRCKAMLSLKDVIDMAGGTIVDTIDEDTIDLSPEALTETTIFEIID